MSSISAFGKWYNAWSHKAPTVERSTNRVNHNDRSTSSRIEEPHSNFSPTSSMDITPPQSNVDVLIIGAGPSGLMCANALGKAGVNARIIDKRLVKIAAGQAGE